MHTISLKWKEYKIHLPSLHTWLKSNAGSHYCGMSGNSMLDIHFTAEPEDSIKEAIAAHMDQLSPVVQSESLALDAHIKNALAAANVAIPYMKWDDMLPAERKLMLGKELSAEDKTAVLAKYPQV